MYEVSFKINDIRRNCEPSGKKNPTFKTLMPSLLIDEKPTQRYKEKRNGKI